jgi:hypothetical protein
MVENSGTGRRQIMRMFIKFAGPALAILAMMALAAQAEAAHVVFWIGGGGACTPVYRPVVIQPVVVQPAVVQPVVVYQPVVYRPVVYRPVVYQPVVYGPPCGWTYAPVYRPVRVIHHAAPCQPARHFGFRARW